MSLELSGPIERGGGLRPYRARKPPFAEVLGDLDQSVIVVRTHDLERADRLALAAWYGQVGDPIRLPVGVRVWARLVPWDPSGEFDRAWITTDSTDRRSAPAVMYDHL